MGSTKCVIPGVHLKVFGRAIQSLSKIGDELYFEPMEEGLSLRTVNSSRSAYACFQFAPSFFITYITSSSSDKDDGSGEHAIRCKLTMKSVMTVFRSLSTIDKTVERCKIAFNMQEDKLVFQLCCRHGIVKTHNLSFMECETLQAIFSRDACPNKLTAGPKLLCDAVINFQSNQEEVTLILRPDYIALKNYVEDDPNPTKVIHTELTLSPDEFDHFQVGTDADVTFCLKEFRAILAFSDLTTLPMNLHIESPGRPITFSITSDLSFEANFVLATLAEPEDAPEQSQQSQRATTAKGSHHSSKSQNAARNPRQKRHHPSHSEIQNSSSISMRDNDDETAINDTTVVESRMGAGRNQQATHSTMKTSNNNYGSGDANQHRKPSGSSSESSIRKNGLVKTINNNDNNTYRENFLNTFEGNSRPKKNEAGFYVSASEESQEMEVARGVDKNDDDYNRDAVMRSAKTTTHPNDEGMDEEMSQIIPIRDEHRSVTMDTIITNPNNDQDEDDEDEEQICGTPPSKRFRSLFFNTQSSTQSSMASQAKPTVLCPDSDSDD